MIIPVEISKYDQHRGIKYLWEAEFTISTEVTSEGFVIRANKAGLQSLARQILTLAQDDAPIGSHFHYDEYNSLEEGSCELVIAKTE